MKRHSTAFATLILMAGVALVGMGQSRQTVFSDSGADTGTGLSMRDIVIKLDTNVYHLWNQAFTNLPNTISTNIPAASETTLGKAKLFSAAADPNNPTLYDKADTDALIDALPTSASELADWDDSAVTTNRIYVTRNIGGAEVKMPVKPGYMSVEWAGAVGDGTTDNTTAFQTAINHMLSFNRTNRFKLTIPEGEYLLDSLFLYDTNAPTSDDKGRYWTIEGAGDGQTVLRFTNPTRSAINIVSGGIRLKDLWLESSAARMANKGLLSGTNGHGIYIHNAIDATTAAPFDIENVHVQNQPMDGLHADEPEFLNVRSSFFQNNGRHGVWMHGDPATYELPFSNLFQNVRSFNNTSEGWYIGGTYGTFINIEGLSNGGVAQFYTPTNQGTRSLILINPDMENQDATTITNAAATTVSFSGNTISDSGATFATDGFTTSHKILITGSTSNDGVYTPTTVNETSIVVAESLSAESAGASIIVNATTANWGMVLNGLFHQVHGGHFSGLVGGIRLDDADDCIITHPTIGNFSSGYEMPDAILVSADASYNTITRSGSSSYWSGVTGTLGNINDLGSQNSITKYGLRQESGPWPLRWKNSSAEYDITPTSADVFIDGENGRLTISNNATDDTAKSSTVSMRHYDVDEEPMSGLNMYSAAGLNYVRIGGGTANGNAATRVSIYNAADATTTTGTEQFYFSGTVFYPATNGTKHLGYSGSLFATLWAAKQYFSNSIYDSSGSGSPEGVVTAPVGSTYRRSDGGTGTSFYVKESGTGNTGWVAK